MEAEGEPVLIPAWAPGKPVNTVGAGDALFSAFLHYSAAGLAPRPALERAVVFAGFKVCANGAAEGFVPEAEIEEVIRRGLPAL